MEIKRGVNKFYIGDTEEDPLAQIILSDIEKNIIKIEHTYVYEQLKGKGAGKQLVKKVVEFAISNNKKVDPICSFAKKEFDNNKEYECVLYNKNK
ncbi:GNAT family N-acetyltransferase [Clostridium sp. C2-6-12]|uniref:GNAT family N-acetyltransferase n=1 Tax=Clostridium sp. C2-6-12 TaxID=2698832 RepID=UPI00136AFE0D|nr:GNAT family N-acetyltransferase [Clostridium sp. C2-6-12]